MVGKLRSWGSFSVAMVLMLILQLGILAMSSGTASADNPPTPTDQQITVLVSGRFSITVKASLPSTGYTWEVGFDQSLLSLVKRYIPYGTSMIGLGDVETFEFEGMEAGETEICLNYESSFEWNNPRIETKTFKVVVLTPTLPPISYPVINSFTVSPSSMIAGAYSVLRWSVSNATSVTIDNGVGSVSSSGSCAIDPVTTTVYTLVASNGANTMVRSVTVNVTPAPPATPNSLPIVSRIIFSNSESAQIRITPNTTPPKLSSRIWMASDVTCLASDPDNDNLDYNWSTDSGKIQGEGSKIRWIAPGISGNYTITVTVADDKGASTSFSIKVMVYCCGNGCPPTVTPISYPVINSFTVSPSSMIAGAYSVLRWSVSNATSVTIDNGVGSVSSSGSCAINPVTTTVYTLVASNGASAMVRSVTVNVTPAPTPPPPAPPPTLGQNSLH